MKYPRSTDEAADSMRSAESPESALQEWQRQMEIVDAGMRDFAKRQFNGENGSGTITVTVDGTGRVLEVYISPYAIRDLSAEELGPECAVAVASARATVSGKLAEHVSELAVADPHTEVHELTVSSPRETASDLRSRLRHLI